MRVLRDQLLVRLVLLPADVAGVVIAYENVPQRPRLRVAGGLAGTSVDNVCALGCAAEDIGAGVYRVSEDLEHRMVGCRPPFDLQAMLLLRRLIGSCSI